MNKDAIKIGFSGAASWAWGTSLIMGQQIAQEKGLIVWIIWAVCNSLTLALFGWLHSHNIITEEIYQRKEVKIIALIIQLFCLLVQLNFINQQFLKLLGSPVVAYFITMAIGFVFTLIVFKKGLPTSVNTDIFQWLIAIVSILIIIFVGIATKASRFEFVPPTSSGVLWGVWSGLILFAGPIGDVQHWQRAVADKSGKAYYIAAGLFAMYMLLILGMACFKFTNIMNVILLIAVLCITTSTIDSIAVATHEIKNKKIGTTVALIMCVIWTVFVQMGMIELWSSFGVIRFSFAIAVLIFPICLKGNLKIAIPIIIASFATIIFFIALGQITVNNIFGIISCLIATIILMYLLIVGLRNTDKVSASNLTK
ncbi:MAG: hypothetical protein J6J60_10590 [Clostridia bacterium]|nr:hypothetical protein [Clostridia bacterium]MBP3597818.1 hypothetical protein [Clostridia bacterium]